MDLFKITVQKLLNPTMSSDLKVDNTIWVYLQEVLKPSHLSQFIEDINL